MIKKNMWHLIPFIGGFLVLNLFLNSQDRQAEQNELIQKAPKVFIDCESCDLDFIRNEIIFINYVRDPIEADIFILITDLPTGNKGTEYTISFIGQKTFKGTEKTLKYYTQKTDTEDVIRRGIVNTLKIGIIPFLYNTPLMKYFSVTFQHEAKPISSKDKWNFWVFSLSTDCSFDGEKSRDDISILGSMSANRITEKWKILSSAYVTYDKYNFKVDENKYTSSQKLKGLNCLVVKSVNDHFSLGGSSYLYSSTYSNIKYNFSLASAFEYDIFPYSQATRRQIRFLYQLGTSINRYYEETIFSKKYECLFYESLSTTVGVKEPWGTITGSFLMSHYFHDLTKYRLGIAGDISLRVIEGLSFNVTGSFSRLHDQLSLSKAGATLEEILLRQKQLATNYYYYLSIGFGYTFGAIYNNVINPRFGTSLGVQIRR